MTTESQNGTVAALAALIKSANLSEEEAAAVKKMLRKPRKKAVVVGIKAWIQPGTWVPVRSVDGTMRSLYAARVGARSCRLQITDGNYGSAGRVIAAKKRAAGVPFPPQPKA